MISELKLEWINHSSFLLEHGRVRLLCDPWIEGYVFDNSWAQLSPTKFSYADFARVTHIWFSHEHPDHFFPPNLEKIAPEIRRNITVLFQATPTADGRVRRFCEALGFKSVVELQDHWYELEQGVRILCHGHGRGDSWLAVKAAGKTVLNVNDCIYLSEDELLPVKESVGEVDLLVTQFSYASWWGNASEESLWCKAAQDALSKITREITVLRPRDIMLAASYVFFCHEENSYMNKHINRVSRAYGFLLEDGRARPIVCYPGDELIVGESWDSSVALRRYETDYEAVLANPVRVRSTPVPLDQILTYGEAFIRMLQRANSLLLLWRVRPATINLTDHQVSLRLSLDGLKIVSRLEFNQHDVSLSSSALSYCLRFPWGGQTLMINGRFHSPAGGDRSRFFRWFSVAKSNNTGTHYDRVYYAQKVLRRARTLLGSHHTQPTN